MAPEITDNIIEVPSSPCLHTRELSTGDIITITGTQIDTPKQTSDAVRKYTVKKTENGAIFLNCEGEIFPLNSSVTELRPRAKDVSLNDILHHDQNFFSNITKIELTRDRTTISYVAPPERDPSLNFVYKVIIPEKVNYPVETSLAPFGFTAYKVEKELRPTESVIRQLMEENEVIIVEIIHEPSFISKKIKPSTFYLLARQKYITSSNATLENVVESFKNSYGIQVGKHVLSSPDKT